MERGDSLDRCLRLHAAGASDQKLERLGFVVDATRPLDDRMEGLLACATARSAPENGIDKNRRLSDMIDG